MCASRQKSTTVTCNVASSLATTSPTGERLVNRFPMMIVIVDNFIAKITKNIMVICVL